MKRSPIWCAAFALAWRDMRNHGTFIDSTDPAGPFVLRMPTPPAEIARWCAAEADACEAAYLAAFPE